MGDILCANKQSQGACEGLVQLSQDKFKLMGLHAITEFSAEIFQK